MSEAFPARRVSRRGDGRRRRRPGRRVIARVRAASGNLLVISGAHVLRVLAARWLGLEPGGGKYLVLGTGSLSVLGYEHDRSEPVLRLWNDACHAES